MPEGTEGAAVGMVGIAGVGSCHTEVADRRFDGDGFRGDGCTLPLEGKEHFAQILEVGTVEAARNLHLRRMVVGAVAAQQVEGDVAGKVRVQLHLHIVQRVADLVVPVGMPEGSCIVVNQVLDMLALGLVAGIAAELLGIGDEGLANRGVDGTEIVVPCLLSAERTVLIAHGSGVDGLHEGIVVILVENARLGVVFGHAGQRENLLLQVDVGTLAVVELGKRLREVLDVGVGLSGFESFVHSNRILPEVFQMLAQFGREVRVEIVLIADVGAIHRSSQGTGALANEDFHHGISSLLERAAIGELRAAEHQPVVVEARAEVTDTHLERAVGDDSQDAVHIASAVEGIRCAGVAVRVEEEVVEDDVVGIAARVGDVAVVHVNGLFEGDGVFLNDHDRHQVVVGIDLGAVEEAVVVARGTVEGIDVELIDAVGKAGKFLIHVAVASPGFGHRHDAAALVEIATSLTLPAGGAVGKVGIGEQHGDVGARFGSRSNHHAVESGKELTLGAHLGRTQLGILHNKRIGAIGKIVIGLRGVGEVALQQGHILALVGAGQEGNGLLSQGLIVLIGTLVLLKQHTVLAHTLVGSVEFLQRCRAGHGLHVVLVVCDDVGAGLHAVDPFVLLFAEGCDKLIHRRDVVDVHVAVADGEVIDDAVVGGGDGVRNLVLADGLTPGGIVVGAAVELIAELARADVVASPRAGIGVDALNLLQVEAVGLRAAVGEEAQVGAAGNLEVARHDAVTQREAATRVADEAARAVDACPFALDDVTREDAVDQRGHAVARHTADEAAEVDFAVVAVVGADDVGLDHHILNVAAAAKAREAAGKLSRGDDFAADDEVLHRARQTAEERGASLVDGQRDGMVLTVERAAEAVEGGGDVLLVGEVDVVGQAEAHVEVALVHLCDSLGQLVGVGNEVVAVGVLREVGRLALGAAVDADAVHELVAVNLVGRRVGERVCAAVVGLAVTVDVTLAIDRLVVALHGDGVRVLADGLPEADGCLVAVEAEGNLTAGQLLLRHLNGAGRLGIEGIHVVGVRDGVLAQMAANESVALLRGGGGEGDLHDGEAVLHHCARVVHPAHEAAHAGVGADVVGHLTLVGHVLQRVVARAPADDAAAGEVALAAVVGAHDVHRHQAVADVHAVALADQSAGTASAGRQRTVEPEVQDACTCRALAEQAARHAAVGVRIDGHLVAEAVEGAYVGHAVADEVVVVRVVDVGRQTGTEVTLAGIHTLGKGVQLGSRTNHLRVAVDVLAVLEVHLLVALLHGHGELVLPDGLPEAQGCLVAVE